MAAQVGRHGGGDERVGAIDEQARRGHEAHVPRHRQVAKGAVRPPARARVGFRVLGFGVSGDFGFDTKSHATAKRFQGLAPQVTPRPETLLI